MSAIFPQLPHPLGGYLLTRLMLVGAETELYEAEQSHMNRAVLIEVLRPGLAREREAAFLNRARLCAAASDLPHVPRVIETLMAEGVWFIAAEMPEGRSLAEIHAAGERLSPIQICNIVEAAAEVYTLLDKAELATIPLTPYTVFLTRDDAVNFISPIQSGDIRPEDSAHNMQYLAALLEPLRPVNTDGESRILSILQWLREGYDGQPVAWDTFTYVCGIVKEQLRSDMPGSNGANTLLDAARTKRQRHRFRRKLLRALGLTTLALLGISALSLLGLLFPQGASPVLPAVHEGMLTIHRHGSTQQMMMRPVSICEYERFLTRWASLSEEEQARVHSNMPATCTDHTPGDWQLQLEAARKGGTYAGRTLSADSPVSNICYWDALAYARVTTRGASLPDAAQLQAAHKAGGSSELCEWCVTAAGENWLGIYPENAPLIIDMAHDATPQPVPDFTYRSPQTGFRLIHPFPNR